jgi:ATP-dependent Clp protease ATP-binding subunit ClpA
MTVAGSAPSEDVARIVTRAMKYAQRHGHTMVTMEHLLYSLVQENEVKNCLKALSVEVSDIEADMLALFDTGMYGSRISLGDPPLVSSDIHDIVTRCIGFAKFSARRNPTMLDLLLHLLVHPAPDSPAIVSLQKTGLTQEKLKQYISHGTASADPREYSGMAGMPGASEPMPTSKEDAERLLRKYCVNLNEEASQSRIDPVIGRENEIDHIVRVTARRTKNNVIMVGDPGVGKTAIVEGMALKIVRKEVPEVLLDTTIWSLDVAALVAGTRYRGDFEERLKVVLRAFSLVHKPVLFIDEIHNIMNAGSTTKGAMDLANLLKPALARGELRCIGSTNFEQFRESFEKDRALLRRFQRVDINEPSPDDAKLILRGLRKAYEEFHGVEFTDAALDAAVDLTHKFIHGACLPDKAIDVMDAAGARNRVSITKLAMLDVEQIEVEVSAKARVPITAVSESDEERLQHLEDDLNAAVFDQNEAVTALSNAVILARSGLREPNKPMGAYLFAGPTGVGKTEVAKQLAKTLGVELVRFDMSEYMEPHTVSLLIGSPPGYVGYGDGSAGSGKLVNEIDKNPSCVLLLDEMEKAHHDVYNVLLQVMDNATMTARNGKVADFRNVVLVMTTNAGAAGLDKRSIGFGSPEHSEYDDAAIKRIFSPEFRNRLDAVVTFGRLKPSTMARIVDKFIVGLNELSAARNVVVDVDKPSREWLAEKGYDPSFGARPLKRLITETISQPLSRLMLFGSLKRGGTANVTLVDGKIMVGVDA